MKKGMIKTVDGTVLKTGDEITCSIQGVLAGDCIFIDHGDCKDVSDYCVILHNSSANSNFGHKMGSQYKEFPKSYAFADHNSAYPISSVTDIKLKNVVEKKPEASLYSELSDLFNF